MRLHRFVSAVLLGALVLVLTACNGLVAVPTAAPTLPVSPLPTQEVAPTPLESPLPSPAMPDAGKASATGRLMDAQTGRPIANQSLSLPAIICPPGLTEEAEKREQCVYAMDIAFDPSTITDEAGRFTFADITAGDYVILVGNPEAKHTVLANDANQPLIWTVEADKVTEFGDLVVDLN